MYSIQKHVAHTHSYTHTPSSPCNPGILVSFLLFFFPCSPAVSDILIFFFSLKSANFSYVPCSLSPRLDLCEHTLEWRRSSQPPVAAGLLMLHMLMHSSYRICSRAKPLVLCSTLELRKTFEFAKDAPCERLCVLRELISPVSVLFPGAQVLFDTVLHHGDTLRFPWPDLLSTLCCACGCRCSYFIFICLNSLIPPQRIQVWHPCICWWFACLLLDLCHSPSYFSMFSGRHPAADDCSGPSYCLWLLWALQPWLWCASTWTASEPRSQHWRICK